MKKIELNFDKTLIGLSGRQLGVKTFENQVKPVISEETPIELVFPNQIEAIASSFAQGLLASELEKYGLFEVKKRFRVSSEVKGVEKSFWESFD